MQLALHFPTPPPATPPSPGIPLALGGEGAAPQRGTAAPIAGVHTGRASSPVVGREQTVNLSSPSDPAGATPASPTTDHDAAFRVWLERYPWVPGEVIRELRADVAANLRPSVKGVVEDFRRGRRKTAHDGLFGWNNSYSSRLNWLIADTCADLRPHLETRRRLAK